MNNRLRDIKQAQREKLLFREITDLFFKATYDDPSLKGISISRVELSSDKSICCIYFYVDGGERDFQAQLDTLKLYKPSLRAALAKRIDKRYTPDLVFKFDSLFSKRQGVEAALNSLPKEEKQ